MNYDQYKINIDLQETHNLKLTQEVLTKIL